MYLLILIISLVSLFFLDDKITNFLESTTVGISNGSYTLNLIIGGWSLRRMRKKRLMESTVMH
jgi:uncharacterized membrane protein YqjE